DPVETTGAHGVSVFSSDSPIVFDEVTRASPGLKAEFCVACAVEKEYAARPHSLNLIGVIKQGRPEDRVWLPMVTYRGLNMNCEVEMKKTLMWGKGGKAPGRGAARGDEARID